MASYQNAVRREEFRGACRRSPEAVRQSLDLRPSGGVWARNPVSVNLLTADVCGERGTGCAVGVSLQGSSS